VACAHRDRGCLYDSLGAVGQVPGHALRDHRAEDAAPAANVRDFFLVSRRLNTWCMLEVLLLGVFVAYTKLVTW